MTETPLLVGIDVEDPRDDMVNGERFPPRVPQLVDTYLTFLRRYDAHATFFIVGKVARRHPEMVRSIVAGGHEVACHSDAHIPLERQDRAALREDLLRNLDALHSAGASEVRGYRAPCFSLVAATAWSYEVLAELGFLYSSSVLPARNPRYGWPGFGSDARLCSNVVELPVTLHPHRLLPVPMGGVYFRALPGPILRHGLKRRRRQSRPVLTYLHPYDMDEGQGFAHPSFRPWSPYGLLMRANRGAVLPRLEMAHRLGFRFEPYGPFAQAQRDLLASGAPQ
jgi:polysaccharide deacetylase family protein (PEP-CTERM system associated)